MNSAFLTQIAYSFSQEFLGLGGERILQSHFMPFDSLSFCFVKALSSPMIIFIADISYLEMLGTWKGKMSSPILA